MFQHVCIFILSYWIDAVQEAEIAKKQRDWAFGERDKIVQERDSIRTLGDKLRRERDRAVSNLAQTLRDFDEMKKDKIESAKELKDVRYLFLLPVTLKTDVSN